MPDARTRRVSLSSVRADLYETGGVGWGDDTTAGFDDASMSPEEAMGILENADDAAFLGGIVKGIGKAVSGAANAVANVAKPIAKPIGSVVGTVTKPLGAAAKFVENASKPIGRLAIPKGVPLLGGMKVGNVTGIALAPAKIASGVLQGQRLDRAVMGGVKSYANTFGHVMPVMSKAVPILKPFAAPLDAIAGGARVWSEGGNMRSMLRAAGQGALSGATSMIPGLGAGAPSLGALMTRQPTLPLGAVRDVAEKLMSNPDLRTLPVTELASMLGVSPNVANRAIASVAGATREVGELGAGALPPLRVPLPAIQKMVGGQSMYKALPKIASLARRPVQTASPIKRRKASKRAVLATPILARLAPQLRSLVVSDAAGLAVGVQAKVAAPSGLNVRAAPDATSKKMGAVAFNSTVSVTNASKPGAKLDPKAPSEGGWTPIKQGAIAGWVLSEWLVAVAAPTPAPAPSPSPAPAPTPAGAGTARVTTADPAPAGDLIIRSAPKATAPQVGAAEKNGLVQVLNWNASTDFAQVRWPGGSRRPAATGYAAKRFLALASAPSPAPGPAPAPPPTPVLPIPISPAAELAARNASATLWLAEWSRQYPHLSPGFGPTDVSPNWTPRAAATLRAFQEGRGGLRTDGVLDDASYEALRLWFDLNAGKAPSSPGGVVVPSPSPLPAPIPAPIPMPIPEVVIEPGPQPAPIPALPMPTPTPGGPPPVISGGGTISGGVSVGPQPKQEGGGSGLLIAGAALVAALALGSK